MAKTAVIYAVDFVLAGVGKSKAEVKTIIGEQDPDLFILVTAKTFVASEQHPSFGEMCGEVTEVKQEAEVAEPIPVLDESGNHVHDEEGNPTFVTVEKKVRAVSLPLEGEYHLLKEFPSTSVEHPKFPIWIAIAENSTVEAAVAACPAEAPARKTSGTYSFSSEFRYFLKKGFVAMGPAGEQVEESVDQEVEEADQAA